MSFECRMCLSYVFRVCLVCVRSLSIVGCASKNFSTANALCAAAIFGRLAAAVAILWSEGESNTDESTDVCSAHQWQGVHTTQG